ncbi:MAG: helix-turn-helix domain-containing protein [Alphaproteobacteria bacterium]|nr:helix-turn-helix domain-containing protein [Alphaproteobacteria bacterium]
MLVLDTPFHPKTSAGSVPGARLVVLAPGIEIAAVVSTFARDEEIFGEGEIARHVFLVMNGVVRTCRILADGRRQIGEFYFPGDVFGLEPNDVHGSSAEALAPCAVAVIKRAELEQEAVRNTESARALWELAARQLARAQEHILLLGRKTARERVASLLLDLADRGDGNGTVRLPMSRADMADYLGLTIETVSRTISELARDGTIRLADSRTVVIPNRGRLVPLAA